MCNSRIPRLWPQAIPLKEMMIPKEVREYCRKKESTHSATIWLCYLQESEYGGLLARTFAFKKNKTHGENLFEVMREYIGCSFVLMRNMYYTPMVGWQCWFPADNEIIDLSWNSVPVGNIPGIFLEILNVDAVLKNEEFKYSGWQQGLPVLEYLRMYCDNPGVEFFGKAGIMPRKSLINKAARDGNFRKWLRNLRKANPEQYINSYGPQAILDAYKAHSTDVVAAWNKANTRRHILKRVREAGGRLAVKAGFSAEKVWEYVQSTKNSLAFYGDYLTACHYLGLDLKDTKNTFPKDLKRMHDFRVNQMQSKQAEEDAKKRKELSERFMAAAKDLKWSEVDGDAYCIIIPDTPDDLVAEGKALHHCVGKMGYDAKMANGTSFIAFVRKVDAKEKPFVTAEFGLKERKLRQCYGNYDSKPADDVRNFVEGWAEKVKEHIQAAEREKKKADEEELAAYLAGRGLPVPEVEAG